MWTPPHPFIHFIWLKILYLSNIFHHPPYCCLNKNENSNPSYDQSMYMLLSLALHKHSSKTFYNEFSFWSKTSFAPTWQTLVLYFSYAWSHHRSSHLGYCGHYPFRFQSYLNIAKKEILWFCQVVLSCHKEDGKIVILKVDHFYLKILCGFVQWYVWQNTVRNQTKLEFLFHKPK